MKKQIHTVCKEGICPLCGSHLNYVESEPDYLWWECAKCNATGKEGKDWCDGEAVFDGQHYNVHDSEGNEVEIVLPNHKPAGISDEDLLCEAGDEIDNAAHAVICALAAVSVEWDMAKIAEVTDAVENILRQHNIPVCHPWEDENGIICYATENRCAYCKKSFTNEQGWQISCNPDEETPLSICDDVLRVDWYNAGEGICGDYDPDEPNDINLLRFDVYVKRNNMWEEVPDASYCTNMPASASAKTLQAALEAIFKRYRAVIDGPEYPSVKKLGEELSYISEADFGGDE